MTPQIPTENRELTVTERLENRAEYILQELAKVRELQELVRDNPQVARTLEILQTIYI